MELKLFCIGNNFSHAIILRVKCYCNISITFAQSYFMKVILDIKDSKVPFVMELLKSFSFIKTQPLSEEKMQLISEMREAVDNLKLVKKGKLKARPARELLDEL